jgi:hypothetical protein
MMGGLHRWFAAGLVLAGPKLEEDKTSLEQEIKRSLEFDIIRLRRIDSIQPNGRIAGENSGWLPK